ncbi:glycosyltransferase family 4 protein [Flavilitoribacter nigricans]|uniref:Glycosyltransferase n=1 Tax=Flavilitoribacter nigricans (strain ATCC 23147 / DSM 23189 / NBRC 102662 / NCIMB 1420 / SS-2) TaxID=1122177 RepID=A0A2D0N9V5_FLAN2|nr:glycosyltransferase family 4 protein [Flavilitoribacter nigricans]PHN05301.1 glycosyltransferase [Flavilitoribacter nigricans DSM 23189 = NBRC 102662]
MAKRIICTVTNDLSYDQRMIRICDSLAGEGYAVLLLGRELPASIPLQKREFGQKRLRCYFHRGKLFYLEYNLRLLLFLLSQSADVICAVDLDTLAPGFLVSRIKGSICVYDAHEYFTEVPEVVDRRLTRAIWDRLARTLVPRLRYAYTVGPRLAGIFREQYGIPFETIRNLPLRQSAHISPPDPEAPRIILYQGRLNAGRGLETAIRAMQQIDGAVLWLAGEGDLSESLRQQVRAAGLEEKVKFLGYLEPGDLRELTLRAHIGLNLLENKGLSYYYSLANKAFDYIQAGLPSVQMDFPEYRDLQEKYGTFALLPQLETTELIRVLRELLEGDETWRELHERCLQARMTLCWEEEEKKLAAFYRRI